MKSLNGGNQGLSGVLGRFVAGLLGLAALVFGLMFSFVFFAFAAVIGLPVFVWLWWKTRQLRKLMRTAQNPGYTPEQGRSADPGGTVIEGEVISAEWQDRAGRD